MIKGIVLAGGSGTRLFPLTRAVSKQLTAVYDKPMIYYPISILMLAGIRKMLIITTPDDQPAFKRLLGDGEWAGLQFEYEIQNQPKGIADAFRIGKNFIGDDRVALVLGDNIFYGHGLPIVLKKAAKRKSGATVFGYQVRDPERYGVVELDSTGRAKSLQEKPKKPRSHFAVTGLYFYDNSVVDIATSLKPSQRGELEITDVNNAYLKKKKLYVEKLGRGVAWLDTGTHESLLQAANFIQTIQERQGLKVSCLEEIAFNLGYISKDKLKDLASSMKDNEYGRYLLKIADQK